MSNSSLTKWRGFDDLARSFFSPVFEETSESFSKMPRINSKETDEAYIVEAEMPGLSLEEISVIAEDGYLSITGDKTSETESERDGYYHREFSNTTFRRKIKIPKSVDASDIEADYKNGILHLVLPKSVEKSNRIMIDIK